MNKRPLILITNDDGFNSKGIEVLSDIALDFGDVVVVAPAVNASGKSHSMTMGVPLRLYEIEHSEHICIYSCEGTPVDCVKIALEFGCPRRPDLILSGINHGSNASINVLYSGTMGAVVEASMSGFPAIGFSLLNHDSNADFDFAQSYIADIIGQVLTDGLPSHVSLNVNIPDTEIRGMRVCRQSFGEWSDCYERRIDPYGHPYYWTTGSFKCTDNAPDTDQWALEHGYISIVPTLYDLTAYQAISALKTQYER